MLDPVRVGTSAPRPRGTAAVFLDRDGVVNDVRGAGDVSLPPRTVDEIVIARDAPDEVRRLQQAGYVLIVVTNQPDVARGSIDREVALQVTRQVVTTLALDDGYVCMHDGPDGCDCRKPRPGMLLRAAADWDLDLDQCWLIGDRWVDVAAAQRAGVRPVLLEASYSWQPAGGADPPDDLAPLFCGPTLASCVSFVLASWSRSRRQPLRLRRNASVSRNASTVPTSWNRSVTSNASTDRRAMRSRSTTPRSNESRSDHTSNASRRNASIP